MIEDKRDRFIVARWAYLFGEPIMSDQEYDNLEREFKVMYPGDPYAEHSWSFDECPTDLLNKYGYSHMICNPTMGYMAESIYSINTWEEFNNYFHGLSERSRLSFKIDGWNTRVSYFNGHLVKVETRGRSGTNLDIKNISSMFPQTIPMKGRVAVTGELNIPHSKWQGFKDFTGNKDQRASVRTAIAQGLVDSLAFLAFNIFIENGEHIDDQYELLKSLGFKTPIFVWVEDEASLKKNMKYMTYLNDGYDYLTDGLVIENSHVQLAIRLEGWEEHAMRSYVTGYEETQGMYGVFMNILCKPITVEGKTFGKVSINNISNIISNRLEIGAPIAFSLRSSANVVIDTGETYRLQEQWAGRYDDYRESIK